MKDKDSELSKEEVASLNAYKQSLDGSTKFIPTWVKIAVAIALGLGTMVGWKRIVITVGRQDPSDLWARCRGGARRCWDHCRGRHVRSPGLDHPSCPRVSPEPWRPTGRGCSCRRSATSCWHGC
jgi:hypothetical protein